MPPDKRVSVCEALTGHNKIIKAWESFVNVADHTINSARDFPKSGSDAPRPYSRSSTLASSGESSLGLD